MEDIRREEKERLLSASSDHDCQGNGVNYFSCNDDASPLLVAGSSINELDDDKAAIQQAIVDTPPTYPVYKRRWYILFIFSLFGFTQSAVWNTWGPISTSSEEAFNWSDSTVAWLSNWGCISFVGAGLFYPWLLEVKGLRVATVSSMFLIAIGSTFRVISTEPGPATILIHFAQMFNGLAGPIAMCAIPQVSSVWFPVNERVTATVINNSINSLGVAIAFIIGPLLVTQAPWKPTNDTDPHDINSSFSLPEYSHYLTDANNSSAARIHAERKGIIHYMYYECGFSWILFLAILCYFPAKPPNPPCESAAVGRDQYWRGLYSLRKKKPFLLMAFIYAISIGVLTVWGSVLNVNLRSRNVSESEAGWIGFYATLGGCGVPLLLMRCADQFTRHMKFYILVLYILGTGCFVAFTLMLIDVIAFSIVRVYVLVIGGTTLINAAVPMMFEIACELAYPTSEGTANGVLTLFNNLLGLIYLAMFELPNIGTMWMNWGLIGSTAICIPLIIVLKGRFHRLDIDEGVRHEVVLEQEVHVEEGEPPKEIVSSDDDDDDDDHVTDHVIGQTTAKVEIF